MSSSSLFVIGDVHGCYKSLKALLGELPKEARIVFLGDVINRGPSSLDCLKLIMEMGKRCVYLLGNHELHFLAVAAHAREVSKKDTFKELLDSKDSSKIVNWLRFQSLVHYEMETLFVHAGVHPFWTLQDTLGHAKEVTDFLRSPNWKEGMKDLFGNTPDWRSDLYGKDRLRAIINVLTRIRFVYLDGTLDLKNSDAPEDAPLGLFPWFAHPARKLTKNRIICGHWSTCGLTVRPDLITLDTGCCWGRELTAVRLPHLRVYQVDGWKK